MDLVRHFRAVCRCDGIPASAILALALAMVAGAGCARKQVTSSTPSAPPPIVSSGAPPTAAPAAPSISFWAEPTYIQTRQSSTIRWEVSGDVRAVSIEPGLGSVQKNGARGVSPSETTTYTLTAVGSGGNSTATLMVRVGTPPPPPPAVSESPITLRDIEQRLGTEVKDLYFDYDTFEVRDREALVRGAVALKRLLADFPAISIIVEGHCDERGSAEYNLGLGDLRSSVTKERLIELGVSADRLATLTFGKEQPLCTATDETCWQVNRRVHFSLKQ